MNLIKLILFLYILLLFLNLTLTYENFKIDMSVPSGQTVSTEPLSKKCLLSKYTRSCDQKIRDIRKPKFKNLKIKDFYPVRESRCDYLDIRDCLVTPTCGWLTNRGGELGRCVRGTPIGPLNPRDIPDPEDSLRNNISLDMWKYSHPNPWVPQGRKIG